MLPQVREYFTLFRDTFNLSYKEKYQKEVSMQEYKELLLLLSRLPELRVRREAEFLPPRQSDDEQPDWILEYREVSNNMSECMSSQTTYSFAPGNERAQGYIQQDKQALRV